MLTAIILFCIGIPIIAIWGLPNIIDSMPHDRVSSVSDFSFNQLPTYIPPAMLYVKAETNGAMLPNNPINVTATTSILDQNQIQQIQLTLLGALQYFPDHSLLVAPTPPPYNASQQEWEQYQNAESKYYTDTQKAMQEESKAIFASTLFMNNETYQPIPPFWNQSIPFSELSIFSGSLQNVQYPVGGTFSIGVSVTYQNGTRVGYATTNQTYILQNALTISPIETKYQIQSNNILIGLGYLAIGFPFLLEGIAEVRDIVKHSSKIEVFAD